MKAYTIVSAPWERDVPPAEFTVAPVWERGSAEDSESGQYGFVINDPLGLPAGHVVFFFDDQGRPMVSVWTRADDEVGGDPSIRMSI